MIVDSNVILSRASPPPQTMLLMVLPQDSLATDSSVELLLPELSDADPAGNSVNPLNALSAPPGERDCVDGCAPSSAACADFCVGPLYIELPGDGGFNVKEVEEEDAEWAEEVKDRSCCYDADDMAGDDQRAEKYIVDIPYSVLLSIYQSLDADKGWESLAAETGYTFDKIRLLELEGLRNQGSPSRSLLWELGSRNTTVRQLYGRLSSLGRYREMKILEDYVHNPSRPSFAVSGLKGLPDVPVDTSSSLKGLKPPAASKKTNNSSNSSSVHSNSINFNQQVATSDVNMSMKCQQTDKHYPGKKMPFLSPSPSPSPSNSAPVRNEAPPNPSSIIAPVMKPSNPGSQMIPAVSNVSLVQKMIKQMPEGASSSGSSSSSSSSNCGRARSQFQTSPSTSSPSSSTSPVSDGPFSSSMSSLPGLESTFDVQMAFMGSACFSYSEVVQATNGFSEQNKLGEGAFGKVYYGVLRKNKCAVKKMAEANGQETVVERSTQIKRELTSLLKYRHENIVTLYGYAVDGESLCLIYQYMPNGSLEDRLMCKKNTPPLVWSQRLNILLGACQGLNFLHTMGEQPLIHGDIKSANILLDKHLEAKIGDLGHAQQANGREGGSSASSRLTHITRAQATTKLYGTRAYQPREVQTGSRPSTKSDVFAMGVVMLEVLSGERAFDERREGEHFLADYFRSLKVESGDEACLSKTDQRGGECHREVSLALLNLADVCTSHLKRKRPDSVQLLQKMTEIDELYTQKTGIKRAGMDSLPGSEHSCHMSHCSSPGASVVNLTGAPPRDLHPVPAHNTPPPSSKPSNTNFSVNVNRDPPAEKHYAMHLHHEEKPDNCAMVNTNTTSDSSISSRSHQQNLPSLSSLHSPINYFQKGQALPAAFRLQKAYDSQNEAERRRISRLSQCPTTQEGKEAEVLPQPNAAKLAALEQFDRENLGGHSEEKESNSFQSDPKKLRALMQFDDQVHHTHMQQQVTYTENHATFQESDLPSDPLKLAQLRLFDDSNMKTVDDVRPEQRGEEAVLASDPRKLAALTQFDAGNCGQLLPSMASQPTSLKPGMMRPAGDPSTQDTFPVSQLDYVVSSQREALKACTSMGQQQQPVLPQSFSLCESQASESVMYTGSVPNPCQTEARLTSATTATHVPAQAATASSNPSEETLLHRQIKFFDMYSKALEECEDDEDNDGDYEDEHADFGCEDEEENEDNSCGTAMWQASSPSEAYSACAQEQVAVGRMDGHCHPMPSEQDESVLNYFKQRQQDYEKTFSKPQASQC